ncbi:MAG: hypothetical protein FJZ10_03230 [Candidatus Omnitrophica bacterium]|nr:hypothetical protein [Candidatus Omnitrophota bacterium]
MNHLLHNQQLHRVVTLLDREEIDFLDKLSKDAQFSTGIKLSRTQILRALVEAMHALGLRTRGIDSEDTLVKKITKILKQKTEK